ncbi:MAG TPA: GNAT family N-acetyltransferase [Gaiellaceae bacterium]|nr:GNAT family N-acetyltransferase [Gaiellaceae bacterium]
MTDELSRVHRFEREIELAGTERVESPLGFGVLTPELPLPHNSNYLFLERAADADEAIAEADRILGNAGRSYRVIFTFDEELGERLRPAFEARRWRTRREVFMVQRRPPEKAADLSLTREVTETALRPGRTHGILAYDWGTPSLAEQILDAKVLLARRAETRFFAVEIDGEIVAWTDLYVAQGVAQIEDVATVERHRGKGYATAVVLRAAEEGRKAGADLVFLVADDDDWPKLLYRRLGFDEIGRLHKFTTP